MVNYTCNSCTRVIQLESQMQRGEEIDEDMKSHFVLATFACLSFGSVVFAQTLMEEQKAKKILQPPLQGASIQPNSSVTVYSNRPSRLLGNTFNRQLGKFDPSISLHVDEIVVVPGVAGNQLWLKVSPTDLVDKSLAPEACSSTGCWSYYGEIDNNQGLPELSDKPTNFSVIEALPGG